MAAEHTQSAAFHLEHMLYFEQGSTVAVGNVLGEGEGSTVQVVAVGSLLELAVGILLVVDGGTSLGVVLGS